jgi:hypothetical protein
VLVVFQKSYSGEDKMALTTVVVLVTDWDNGDDPIAYYATDPDGCLDFHHAPKKPRAKLSVRTRKAMADCDHGVSYEVNVCDVQP